MKLVSSLAGSVVLAFAFASAYALDDFIYFIRNEDSDHSVSYSFKAGSGSYCMYGVYTPTTDSMPPYYLNISKLGLHYKATILTKCSYGNKPRSQDIVISRDTPPKATAVVTWFLFCPRCDPWVETKYDPTNMLQCPYDRYGYTSSVMVVVGENLVSSSASCTHNNFRE